MKHHILFLYLRTGGGHLAPARSIVNYITRRYSQQAEAKLIDGFADVNKIVKHIVEDGYRKSQAKAIWVFEVLYAFNKLQPIARITAITISFFVRPHLEKLILREKPQKIVIFHSFLIKPVVEIVKRNKLSDTTVVTVVTDPFTAPPIWFLEKTDKYIVFSEKLQNYGVQKMGISQDDITVFPFIIEEKFTNPLPPEDIASVKEALGFPMDKKIILILGGGDGIPKGEEIIKSFVQSFPDANIAIVCGHNKELYHNLWRLKSKHNLDSLYIYGYVNIIYELINVSDIVISKCGASTFMEILASGKVPVISNYIWEQEKGNMEFIRDNELGIYESDISKLPEKTMNILQNESVYNFYANNIRNAKIQNGTPQVSEFLLSL